MNAAIFRNNFQTPALFISENISPGATGAQLQYVRYPPSPDPSVVDPALAESRQERIPNRINWGLTRARRSPGGRLAALDAGLGLNATPPARISRDGERGRGGTNGPRLRRSHYSILDMGIPLIPSEFRISGNQAGPGRGAGIAPNGPMVRKGYPLRNKATLP